MSEIYCPKCGCYYRPLKNGVEVCEKTDGVVTCCRRGDKWGCPICGSEVIVDFGDNQGLNPVEGSGYGKVEKVDFRNKRKVIEEEEAADFT